ncbi:dihydrodipicolinate synthase family protein, partial [Nonomuraea wenchangensis]|uniref:dihydrodipicolinate synthase family protein n=1 Tax=Nonomuraea wenchangensis TaxID=568860 RepID=UPI003331F78A
MLDRVRRAATLEPGAIQVILPDWMPLNDDEVIRFLTGAAEAAGGVPLVLYNPPHAKTQVPPRLLARAVREVPRLIGVKTAGGDHAWYAAMAAVVPRPSIFVPGHLLATGLTLGADGSYSNIAAMSPRGAAAWYRLMRTDPAAALDVERRIGQFFRLHLAPLRRPGCPTRRWTSSSPRSAAGPTSGRRCARPFSVSGGGKPGGIDGTPVPLSATRT